MALTCGFFNSQNGDRRYNAKDFGSIFDGVIRDGVFQSEGNQFMVTPKGIDGDKSGGMKVYVASGRGWFLHTWTLNTSDASVSLSASDSLQDRIDAIVLDVNHNTSTRANSLKAKKGKTYSSITWPPATSIKNDFSFADTPDHKEIPLAYVRVRAKSTSISGDADIFNVVTKTSYGGPPWVTGPLTIVDTNSIYSHIEGMWANFMASAQGELDALLTDGQHTLAALANYQSRAEQIISDMTELYNSSRTILSSMNTLKEQAQNIVTSMNTLKGQAQNIITSISNLYTESTQLVDQIRNIRSEAQTVFDQFVQTLIRNLNDFARMFNDWFTTFKTESQSSFDTWFNSFKTASQSSFNTWFSSFKTICQNTFDSFLTASRNTFNSFMSTSQTRFNEFLQLSDTTFKAFIQERGERFSQFVEDKNDEFETRMDDWNTSFSSFWTEFKQGMIEYLAAQEDIWTNWFVHIQGQLSDDAATNLQRQIDALSFVYILGERAVLGITASAIHERVVFGTYGSVAEERVMLTAPSRDTVWVFDDKAILSVIATVIGNRARFGAYGGIEDNRVIITAPSWQPVH